MPKATQFIREFNLYNNMVIGPWILLSFSVNEFVYQRYHKYGYHITLVFNNIGYDINILLKYIKQYFSPRTIITPYGNPYYTQFIDYNQPNNPQIRYEHGKIILQYIGVAERT